MNRLYYVVTYNQRRNEKARFMVTAGLDEDRQGALDKVIESLPFYWSIDCHSLVCQTHEEVFMEL